MRMPALVATLFAVTFLALTPSSGDTASLEPGLRAGLNVADFRGFLSETADMQPKLGFVGGGFLAIGLTTRFALQGELLYSMKGGTLEMEARSETGELLGVFDLSYDLQYLEVPILATWRLPVGSSSRVTLLLGPSLGFLLDAKAKLEGPFVGELDLEAVTEDLDLGGAFGIGWSYGPGSVRYLIDARYTTSVSDSFEGGTDPSMNSVFSFTAGVSF